jgi:CCR4-NOT transcription complex subunit 1
VLRSLTRSSGAGIESVSYQAVDAFAKLVVSQVKYTGGNATAASTPSVYAAKTAVLTRVLNIVVKVLMQDYEAKKAKFNQRPYFRVFDNWLIEFNNLDADPVSSTTANPGDNADNTDGTPTESMDTGSSSDSSTDSSERGDTAIGGGESGNSGAGGNSLHLQILVIFGRALSALQPSRLPGFAFAWLELISHRNFMAKLLLAKGQKGWPLFQGLLGELFHFLEPYLRSAELTEPIRLLYKGTLRVLLVLLHDFPEFLCDFHFSFCDVIPPSCIQMRNLILSAFPRAMRLPDPFTPNLKVDLLPEINQPPRILSNYLAALSITGSGTSGTFRSEVDTYLKTRTPISFLIDMRPRFLLLSPQEAVVCGTKYNVPVINSIVLYVGMQAIAQLQNKSSQVYTNHLILQ